MNFEVLYIIIEIIIRKEVSRMTLNGANKFSENQNYEIYTINSQDTGRCAVILPKNLADGISMLVDLNMKSVFDNLINNIITKDDLVRKIDEEYEKISKKYPSGVIMFPMLDREILANIISSNDKQKMIDETKKISGVTSVIYNDLTTSGIEKSRINQKLMIIEKNDIDIKFVNWLKEQMPNFVDGVDYQQLSVEKAVNNNPFANVNPFTGESVDVEERKQPVNDIFGPTNDEQSKEEVNKNDIFASNSEPVSNNVFDPKPVQDVNLNSSSNQDGALVEPKIVSVSEPQKEENNVSDSGEVENSIDKKSGGFANLLILLVILTVVTVVSIQLGKFLYNTFGA